MQLEPIEDMQCSWSLFAKLVRRILRAYNPDFRQVTLNSFYCHSHLANQWRQNFYLHHGQKPTFIFIGGAWHRASVFTPLQAILEAQGYECIPLSLPSVGCKPVTHDFTEDVDHGRKTITALADQGKDIIPVMHSYGGMPGSQALEGLGKEGRSAQQLEGGVVRLVYVMAMMLCEGTQPASRGTVDNMPAHMKADLDKGIVTVAPSDALTVFYNDISPDVGQKLASQLEPHSIGVFWSTVTYAPWRKIPTTYVLLENDQSFTMGYAEYLLGAAKSTDNHKIDTLEKYNSGHFVMVSHPDWLAKVLRRAAGDNV